MSIPKLKVYRLDTDFDESNDTDIQSQTKDELLPIVGKELNPLTAAEDMVGVKLRGDCRVVSRGSLGFVDASIDPDDALRMKTVPVPCEGWIMGKANIDVAVLDAAGSGWRILDKRLWDYDVVEMKRYLVDGAYQDAPEASGTSEIHNISHIVIRFGAMMAKTSIAGGSQNPDYSSQWNADGGLIRIYYYPYSEHETEAPVFGLDAVYGTPSASAPFSSIYNGNHDGRTLHYTLDETNVLAGGSLPDGASIVRTRMNRYEGNYLYRRRIFPLRVKPIDLSGGSGTVAASFDWYADGMMAPVFMEKVPVPEDESSSGSGEGSSSGPVRWVYKRLEEGTQFTKVYDVSVPEYTITMNKSYYRLSGDQYCYPERIYMFYNFMDDNLGELFDFDFRYSDTSGAADTMLPVIQYDIFGGYGIDGGNNQSMHMNSGTLVSGGSGMLDGNFHLRQEFLAVMESFGYNAEMGDVVLRDTGGSDNSVVFRIPQSFSRNGNGGYVLDTENEVLVYHEGKLIGRISSISSPSVMTYSEYSVSISGNDVTVVPPLDSSVDSQVRVAVHDLMVSCLVKPPSGDDIVGYRVPCYEKVKKASLFVSSFPNWLKGHLNNDLDVFVGYQQYSGVNTVNEQIDSIYPKYVKDGWHPMYPEGALQFTEPVEEYDYYDIFNFGAAAGGAVEIPSDKEGEIWTEVGSKLLPNYCPTNGNLGNYRIYCNKVMYNVARYDAVHQVLRARMSNISVQGGVSRYRLLTDEAFSEAYGRRWTYRHDGTVRRMYSAGQEELPRILDSSENGRERPPAVSTISRENGTLVESETEKIVRANLSSDRVMFIRYVLTGNPVVQNGFIVCLNKSSAEYAVTDFGELDDSDIRIHVCIEGGVLKVGPETSQAPVAGIDPITVFSQPVDWSPLQDRPDEIIPGIDEDVDLDEILDAGGDGNGALYRYTYTGFPEFDVCFEPVSYHYTNAQAQNGRQVVSVEFMVYKAGKS